MLRGFTAQAALDAPRFCISAGMPDPDDTDPAAFGAYNGEVYFEDIIPMSTIQKLRGMALVFICYFFSELVALEMGHDARTVSGFGRGAMGRGQVIQKIVDASGKTVWAAGSDPRSDGHAVAQI